MRSQHRRRGASAGTAGSEQFSACHPAPEAATPHVVHSFLPGGSGKRRAARQRVPRARTSIVLYFPPIYDAVQAERRGLTRRLHEAAERFISRTIQ